MKRNIVTLTFLLVLATAVTLAQAPQNSQPTQQPTVTPKTSQSETQNNTAGSISGNVAPTNASPTQNPQTPQQPNTTPGATPDPTQPTIDKTAPQQSSSQPEQPSTPPVTAPGTTQGASPTPGSESSLAGSGPNGSGVVDSATLKGQLESAFQAEPTLTRANIQVNVNDTAVELTGTVPTGKEKTTAKRIAQSYAGNRKVIDKMTVSGRGTAPQK